MTCATLARPPFPGCLPRLDRPPCLEHLTVPGLLYHTFFLTLSYLHGTAVRTTRALPVVPGVPVVMINSYKHYLQLCARERWAIRCLSRTFLS
jgi:hypothetical protein